MSREIKFRVWCMNKNEWEEHECVLLQNGRVAHITRSGVTVVSPLTHIPVFYTGRKDKNGKEIYEGDLISCWHKDSVNEWCGKEEQYIAPIIWEHSCWYAGFGNFHNWNIGKLDEGSASKIEVIGNIYENPELQTDRKGLHK